MKAAVMRDSRIVFDQVPEPVPGAGQVLVRTLACGICGSDLHFLRHARELLAARDPASLNAERLAKAKAMAQSAMDVPVFTTVLDRDIVMGHEFCAEVLEYGPVAGRRWRRTRVTSCRSASRRRGRAPVVTVGYSNDLPGGYGERMVLPESSLLPVPDHLSTDHAALTEPMAVGLHAVGGAASARRRGARHRLRTDRARRDRSRCGCTACTPSSPPTSRRDGASSRVGWAPTWSSIRRVSSPYENGWSSRSRARPCISAGRLLSARARPSSRALLRVRRRSRRHRSR